MKPYIAITIIMLFGSTVALGQQDSIRSSFGVAISGLGTNAELSNLGMDGAPGYKGNGYFNLELTYFKSLNMKTQLETGIGFARHSFIISPNLPPQSFETKSKEQISIITVPLILNRGFGRFLFLNGGIILSAGSSSRSLDAPNGIGAFLGTGTKYDFNSAISIFINPYLKALSLISFSANGSDVIFESGFRFGFNYHIGQ